MNCLHHGSIFGRFRGASPSAGLFAVLLCLFLMAGCSALFTSAAHDFVDGLSMAVLDNNDLATVEAGSPAYLLMIDAFLYNNPDNESMLRSAATLYSAYTEVFVRDQERSRRLSEKALGYAIRAVCVRNPGACVIRNCSFSSFETIVSRMDKDDVPALFALGAAWAEWIQARLDDWNAIAEISRVETVMKRVIELDETYQKGGAHLYLGAISTMIPAPLGGKPEQGKIHFERAMELSEGRNLMIKLTYARLYARLMFDKELHDRLLHEVLEADPCQPGYTLINHLAQRQARELLNSADDYF